MLNFACDYLDGAHPKVLEALTANNYVKTGCYGEDDCFCESATNKIRAAAKAPNAHVWYLSGGTQTNMVVISSILKPWQGVIAADTGHIAVHEAGAIECAGHKVLTIKGKDGKISAEQIEHVITAWEQDGNCYHMVQPGMVYITQPTELGTSYSLTELEAISKVCREHKVPLFMDGARMFYGLAAKDNDVTLTDIARLTDVFYIGGTKCGLLFGEAVVFPKGDTVPYFFSMIKQKGALMAKSKVLGIQFDALFTDDLGMEMGRHGDEMADLIREALIAKGYELVLPNRTNQIFIRFTNDKAKELEEKVIMGFWERTDDEHVVMRIATSWSTNEADVERLIELL